MKRRRLRVDGVKFRACVPNNAAIAADPHPRPRAATASSKPPSRCCRAIAERIAAKSVAAAANMSGTITNNTTPPNIEDTAAT